MAQSQEIEEKDVYVYLDFQGKDISRALRKDNVYFRMLNLSENKPIVEIGDDVYEGTYDDAVGTNLFFEEIPERSQNTSLFEIATPLTLEFLLKQTKILKLTKIGTRQKIVLNTPQTETVNINIKDDYRILLEKFENNKLNIDEFIVEIEEEQEEIVPNKNVDEHQLNSNYKWELSKSPPRQNRIPEWYKPLDNSANQEQVKTPLTNAVSLKYTKLQKIAEQPSKRIIKEEVKQNDRIEKVLFSPKTNFILWKNLMMQKVEHQVIAIDVKKGQIEDFVDVEESIKAKIISPSSENSRIFTEEEKSRLLSFENFANVSPLMKLIMLQDYEDSEKAAVEQMLPDELSEVGPDGYTASERYDLIHDFKEELKNYLVARLREQYECCSETPVDFNLDIALSDNENNSDSSTSFSDNEDDHSCLKSSAGGVTSNTDPIENEREYP